MKYKHLSILEREKLQELLWQKKSIRHIAQILKRSPSSISRELRRNYPEERERYTPRLAHEKALTKRTQRGRDLGQPLPHFSITEQLTKFQEQGGTIVIYHSKDDPVVDFAELAGSMSECRLWDRRGPRAGCWF